MSIKMTLNELIKEASPALKKLSETKFRGKVRLRITRLLSAVMAEEKIWDATRIALIAEYKYRGPTGESMVPQDCLADFVPKIDEVLSQPVELNIGPLKLSLLENYDIEPMILVEMGPLIVDDIKDEDDAPETDSQ